MYVHMYICIYIYMYVYICIYIYMYIMLAKLLTEKTYLFRPRATRADLCTLGCILTCKSENTNMQISKHPSSHHENTQSSHVMRIKTELLGKLLAAKTYLFKPRATRADLCTLGCILT